MLPDRVHRPFIGGDFVLYELDLVALTQATNS